MRQFVEPVLAGTVAHALADRGEQAHRRALDRGGAVPLGVLGESSEPVHRPPGFLGRGFERFYGFLAGETDQFHPDLVYDNHQVDPPSSPEDGYHLSKDLADQAIGMREAFGDYAPSRPQMREGARIGRTLAAWRATFTPGPPVPFAFDAPDAGKPVTVRAAEKRVSGD